MAENNHGLGIFPNTHIKPYDGMAITADVWAQAHEEHRQARRAHDLVLHGAGIVSGLQVMPNDPADQFVYISPGVAIDPVGNLIVLSERVAYDFGKASSGELYLLLGYGEREIGGVDEEARYSQDEYVISARSSLPKRPYVELARVTLSKAGAAIRPAADAVHPQIDELDLRFRNQVVTSAKTQARVALCNLGGKRDSAADGWAHLSAVVAQATHYRLIVDQDVPLSETISNYDLVYLACNGSFELSQEQQNLVKKCIADGKTVFFESFSEEADAACRTAMDALKLKPKSAGSGDTVLHSPNLFPAPPQGSRGEQVDFGGGVILSSAGYADAWAGAFSGTPATREQIRTAHEWGVNLVTYCLKD